MFHLLTYAKNYRKQILLGPFFKFVEAFLELLLPLFLARLIDEGLVKHNATVMWQTAGWMFFFSVAGLLSAIVCQYYASLASQGFGTALRNALMAKINRFSYVELDQFGTDTLITRLSNDINQVQTALAMFIRLFVRAPFLSLGSIIMAFYINWKIGLIFLVTLPLFIILLFLVIHLSVPLYQKVQQTLDKFNNQLSQNFTGVRVIRAFAKRDVATKKTVAISDDLAHSYKKVANLSALLSPATTLILNLGILAILYFGGHLVNVGGLQQGEVLALINYMTQMLLALIVVANLVVLFTRAEASGQRVWQVLATPVAAVGTEKLTDADLQVPTILSFADVSLSYTKKSGDVLQHLTFSLPAGTTFGVIGATGSGKSSLIPLILREYVATSGTVSLFEKNSVDLDKTLKNYIGWVPQQAVLFSGTIRDNLAFGKSAPTDEECYRALSIAQIDDLVKSLPDRLETVVQAGGKNFSGGERQRLTIARALIKEPRLLILDDALSALDYQTDLNLRQALHRQLQATTVILISQRTSTLHDAEQILVLADGQQVGLATHAELLQTNATYQKIYDSQQEAPHDHN